MIELHDDGLTLEFTDAFPYSVRNGILVFTDGRDNQEPQTTVKGAEALYPYGSLLEFDAEKRETAWHGPRLLGERRRHGPGSWSAPSPDFSPSAYRHAGNILVFGPSHRDCPAIVVSDSAGGDAGGS